MVPIFLLADSIPLFSKDKTDQYCLHTIRQYIPAEKPRAIYIGASNGDIEDFFEIFCAGMENIGILDCYHVKAAFTPTDRTQLESADLIFLAGGDVMQGWEVLKNTGMRDIILSKYAAGTSLIGLSAGAIQLGWEAYSDLGKEIIPMMQLVSFNLSAHDEANEWSSLKEYVCNSDKMKRGIGICRASALVCYPDQQVEVLVGSGIEMLVDKGELRESILLPKLQ